MRDIDIYGILYMLAIEILVASTRKTQNPTSVSTHFISDRQKHELDDLLTKFQV